MPHLFCVFPELSNLKYLSSIFLTDTKVLMLEGWFKAPYNPHKVDSVQK